MGKNILGPSFAGTYNLVPPPGADMLGFGFKKAFKKVGRGVKKAGKKGFKVAKKANRVAVKVSLKPLKTVAKLSNAALKASAKLAARPIISIVNKLAGRRAKYLAFKKTGSTVTTLADRKAGGQYALSKLKKAGPLGTFAVKILKYTGGVTAGDTLGASLTKNTNWREDAATCGVAPVAIAAAAASIVTSVTAIMKALNKPGEAPANPQAAAKQAEPTEETQPVVTDAEAPANEEAAPAEETATEEEAPAEEAAADETEGVGKSLTLDEQIEIAQASGNRALLKKLAAKWRRAHGEEWGAPPPSL